MRIFDLHWLKAGVAKEMRRQALRGSFDGTARSADYLDRCTAIHAPTGSCLILTRDLGMHTSGWWKNPEYERCFHLSLSFQDPDTSQTMPKDDRLTRDWVEVIFGSDRKLLWVEPPSSKQGIARETYHYRLFCNTAWEPILPQGEVYSKKFTEIGWKSFSELHSES